jgi:hypothetical protein
MRLRRRIVVQRYSEIQIPTETTTSVKNSSAKQSSQWRDEKALTVTMKRRPPANHAISAETAKGILLTALPTSKPQRFLRLMGRLRSSDEAGNVG